jgi:hypothetical protein
VTLFRNTLACATLACCATSIQPFYALAQSQQSRQSCDAGNGLALVEVRRFLQENSNCRDMFNSDLLRRISLEPIVTPPQVGTPGSDNSDGRGGDGVGSGPPDGVAEGPADGGGSGPPDGVIGGPADGLGSGPRDGVAGGRADTGLGSDSRDKGGHFGN